MKRSYSEWLSFSQLIQELIGGVIRRHIFSQWELDLLLDLQLSRMGKTARRGRYEGRKPSWKKAYVTLKQGENPVDYGEEI